MCLVALITKGLWLTRNLHTKPPFTLAQALSTAARGGNAILKLQLRHIPETAKLNCFQTSAAFSSGCPSAHPGRPPNRRAGWQLPTAADKSCATSFITTSFQIQITSLGVTVSSHQKSGLPQIPRDGNLSLCMNLIFSPRMARESSGAEGIPNPRDEWSMTHGWMSLSWGESPLRGRES